MLSVTISGDTMRDIIHDMANMLDDLRTRYAADPLPSPPNPTSPPSPTVDPSTAQQSTTHADVAKIILDLSRRDPAKRTDIYRLLTAYGATAAANVPANRLDDFAADLRQLGGTANV